MKIINLYAGPGTGKSTTAAGLFYLLKLRGFKCEICFEYAKDIVWEGRDKILADQLYIFAKQHRRLARLIEHSLDYIITDSPLLLSLIYGKNESLAFKELVYQKYQQFENYDFFLERIKPYASYGRIQTESEAKILDEEIRLMLAIKGLSYKSIKGDENAPALIIENL